NPSIDLMHSRTVYGFFLRRQGEPPDCPSLFGVVAEQPRADYRFPRYAGLGREDAMFKGSLVALITPFRNGKVDETAFQEHVAWQLGQGTHGLVPIGTTGECPTLDEDEQRRLIELTVEVAKGRAPVIPGTGFNSTAHTVEATRHAKEAGADAALVVCPYYNKPTQEGLYQHFKAVHDAVDLPIIIYNIPGRSAV